MEFFKHYYGQDFGALRSVLGLSKEELAKITLLEVETINKIENSENFYDIDTDSVFRVYYLAKIIEEDSSVYLQNSTISKLAGIIASKGKEVIKSKAKEREMAEIKKQYDMLGNATNAVTVPEVLKQDHRKTNDGLTESEFFDLLLSTMIVRDYQPPILDLYELEDDLRKCRDNDSFNELFADIKQDEEGNYDLVNAFRKATDDEELIKISNGIDNVYLINITEDTAKKHLKYYSQEDILNMAILVDRLKEKSLEHEQERGPLLQKIHTVTRYAA